MVTAKPAVRLVVRLVLLTLDFSVSERTVFRVRVLRDVAGGSSLPRDRHEQKHVQQRRHGEESHRVHVVQPVRPLSKTVQFVSGTGRQF